MSHIVSFSIEGLAGREKPLECELNRDTNIFFGPNGCGKTSLLKILHAAMANDTEILVHVPFTSAKVQIYSLDWDKVFTRSIKIPSESKPRQSVGRRAIRRELLDGGGYIYIEESSAHHELKWECKPSQPAEASHTPWQHEYLPTSRLHVGTERFPFNPETSRSNRPWLTEDQLDIFFARSVEYLWSRYSAQVLSSVRAAQEQGLASILRAVLSPKTASRKRKSSKLTPTTAYERVHNFLERQDSLEILSARADFDKQYKADKTLQDIVQDIDVVENRIKSATAARDALQDLISKMFAANKEIKFTEDSIEVKSSSGDKIGLASLSSGEKHLLRIFVQVLLTKDNTLMIDEPEISMHIDWQKSLIDAMRSLNSTAQLIFATHSPEIMADISDDKIFQI